MTPQEREDTVVHQSSIALQDVHHVLSDRVYELIYQLSRKEGLYYAAQMGLRTMEQQNAIWAQSRYPAATVNTLRKVAGLGPISVEEANRRVTGLRVSYHCFGLAVDLVEDGNIDKPGVQWDWSKTKDYLVIGKYAKQCGLEWGGLWTSMKDYPHVQMTYGLTIPDCVRLYKADGLESVWSEIDKRMHNEHT